MIERKNPDAILASITDDMKHDERGKLKIFFGYCAGVGKTYAMLESAHEQIQSGVDVVSGYVEPHKRIKTTEKTVGIPCVPAAVVVYKTMELFEPDVDAIIERNPDIVLIDELAHTNAPSMRNKKRYQDIEELLLAGIGVYTTVNVQHLESLNDKVEEITGIQVLETIPDYIFDQADEVELVDISPSELLSRLDAGNIYHHQKVRAAKTNFFTYDNLRLLREISLRKVSERISDENQLNPNLVAKRTAIKILVCIGTSKSTQKYLRHAATLAKITEAKLIAVHVEQKNQDISKKERSILNKNFAFAMSLGADLIILEGYDVAEVIAEYAKNIGVTDIVIGKDIAIRRISSVLSPSLSQKLLEALPQVEFHLISNDEVQEKRFFGTLKNFSHQQSLDMKTNVTNFFAVIMLYVGTVVAAILLEHFKLGEQNIIMLFLLFIVVATLISANYIHILISIIASVLTYDFLFVEPFFNFHAFSRDYPVTFVVMFSVAIIVSQLTFRMKNQARSVMLRERRTRMLYELSQQLLVTREKNKIIDVSNEYLSDIFGRSIVFFTSEEDKLAQGVQYLKDDDQRNNLNLLDDYTYSVANWSFRNQKVAGFETDTLTEAEIYVVPLIANGESLGAIGVAIKNKHFSAQSKNFLQVCSSQISLALERQKISDTQKKVMVDVEKETMRSNLLRSISHDLRSPLTSILGSTSTLLSSSESDTKEEKLLLTIEEESKWLIQMVENLLAVTRISDGTTDLVKQEEVVEEVIEDVIRKVRTRYPSANIYTSIADDIFMVPMDPILIIQVLLNLIENALKYIQSDAKVIINVYKDGDDAVFTIQDNGHGMPDSYLTKINSAEDLQTLGADRTRGLGIGLSLCKTIIKAHGGIMEIENIPGSGVQVLFKLPFEN